MAGKTESLTETLAKQAEAKFSAIAGVEKEERAWIASLLPSHQDRCDSSSVTLHELLKDGVLLCELINHVAESSVTKPSTSNLPFKQRENISSYLGACEKLGMSQTELFETSDLFESKNLALVLKHISALHLYVAKHGGSLKEKVGQVGSGKLSTAKKTISKQIGQEPSGASTQMGTPPGASKSTKTLKAGTSPLLGSPTAASSVELGSPSRAKTPSVASLAADIATKEEFKYNPEVEAAAQRWISKVLGVDSLEQSFFQFLKSGVVLCKLANAIKPGVLPHIYEGGLAYRQMENIGWYITACQQFGMRDEDLFETADLFAERNLNAVANHIHVLAHWLVKRPEGWKGPQIDDVRTAKSLFSATLVEPNWDKISQSSSSSLPLTDDQKDLLQWANAKLNTAFLNPPVEIQNLSSDLQNGLKLIHLLNVICRGQSFGIYNTEPTLIWHAMQNATAILAFVASQTFQKVEGIRAVDIVTGNVTAISKLLFYLREKFDLDYLFVKTLGTLQSSASSDTNDTDTEADMIEVEILEGEDVPAHLRPLMSPEDLLHYDRLAAERRAQEEEEMAQEEQIRRQNASQPSTPRQNIETLEISETSATARPVTPTTMPSREKTQEVGHVQEMTVDETLDEDPEVHEIEVVEEPHVAGHAVKALSPESHPHSAQQEKPIREHTPQKKPKSDSSANATPDQTDNGSIPNADSPTTGKRPRRNKVENNEKGTSSPKLKDSSENVDSTASPSRSKSKGKIRREKIASNEAAAALAASSKSSDSQSSIAVSSDSTRTSSPQIDSASREASNLSASDAVQSASASNSSENLVAPSPWLHVTRQHSHSRERSIPRRVNVKRTATFGSNVVTADQEKVLKAQQVVRKHVATETLTTEQSYLNSLTTIIRELLEPVKRAKVLTQQEYASLFSNLEELAQHHVRFESLLRARISAWDDASVLADIFLKETDFFVQYGPYLENYNKATVAMHYMRKKYPKFDQMIRNFEEEQMKTTMQTVDSFLIMPVQRLPRYRLLLSDMRKYTPQSWQEHLDLDSAGRKVDEVIRELNSHIPKDGAEQIRKMLAIESSIQQQNSESVAIMKLDRKFIKEGSLLLKKLKVGDKTKPEKKKLIERMKGLKAYVFLFNDLLVICEQLKQAKSDDKCQFGLVHAYNLNDVLIISEKERSEKNMDQIANFTIKHVDKKAKDLIVYLHAESDLIIIHTNSSEEKDAWIAAFQQRNNK
jgi:hypothetical protein